MRARDLRTAPREAIALRPDALLSGVAPSVAALAALVVIWAGGVGVDLPAHVYDVAFFRRYGFTLWDSQLYGGHWTLGYSVLYSPVAATIGMRLTAVVSACLATWAFDRLVVVRYGSRARPAAIAFAVGTLAQVAIGQLPFLLGEAFGMLALLCVFRRRWLVGGVLAVAAALSSPLAGAFVALVVVTLMIASWPERRGQYVGILAASLLPIGALQVLYPQGAMPFSPPDFALELVVFAALLLVIPREERGLRIGVALYVVAIVGSFVLPTAMGGNIVRLGGCVGLPLILCALDGRRRIAAAVLLAPILVMTWAPAWTSITSNRENPSIHAAYYTPMVAYLEGHAKPLGRVEIVPTALHWEATYVAPHVALARGWERQVDSSDNPIFYDSAPLTAASYHAWLVDNGVRYVAVPDVQLDYAGKKESRLLDHAVPGLRLAWRDAHWRVYAVEASPGILSGPGRLLEIRGGEIRIDALHAGTLVVRVRPAQRWTLTGSGCLESGKNEITVVDTRAPGQLTLRLQPSLLPRGDSDDTC